jgi:hypothetical protein
LVALTLDGAHIEDLGVYVYAPPTVVRELEKKRAAFSRGHHP